ncbi:hypothetical protein BGX31_004211, partial [Mortierella sp. GBA43]
VREYLRFKIKARQGKVGKVRTLFKAVFIAMFILEGHNVASPVDGRVMSLEPVYPKDNGMVLNSGHVRGHGFMVVGNGKGNLNMVYHWAV